LLAGESPTLFGELSLIYDPVKRLDRSNQIRTAIALAKVRFCAHLLILTSLAGFILTLLGVFVQLPRLVGFSLVAAAPTLMLLGIFLMNRILHKEKEFKGLQWRLDAVRFGDPELRRLLSLPFSVDLRNCSPISIEQSLKEFEEKQSTSGVDKEKGREKVVTELLPWDVAKSLSALAEMRSHMADETRGLLDRAKQMDFVTRRKVVQSLTRVLIIEEEVVLQAIEELLLREEESRERDVR